MMLEREIGRVHAEELAASRSRHGSRRPVRLGLAARLHRLADRLEHRVGRDGSDYES